MIMSDAALRRRLAANWRYGSKAERLNASKCCLLLPQEQTWGGGAGTSAKGQTPTFDRVQRPDGAGCIMPTGNAFCALTILPERALPRGKHGNR